MKVFHWRRNISIPVVVQAKNNWPSEESIIYMYKYMYVALLYKNDVTLCPLSINANYGYSICKAFLSMHGSPTIPQG